MTYKNLAEVFWKQVKKNKNKALLLHQDNDNDEPDYTNDNESYMVERKYSWNLTAEHTKSIAICLDNFNIAKESKVIIWAGTSPEWIITDLAVLSLGAVTIPVFPSASTDDLKLALELTEAKTIFVQNSFYLRKIAELIDSLDYKLELENIIIFEEDLELMGLRIKLDQFNIVSWAKLIDLEYDFSNIESIIDSRLRGLSRDDMASIIFTSGTTANPKAVVLSHGNILSAIEGFKEYIPINSHDRFLSALPLSHIFERTACEFYAIYASASIYFPYNYKDFSSELKEKGITILNLVPRMLEKIYEKIDAGIERNKLIKFLIKIPMIKQVVFKIIKNLIAPKLKCFVSGGAALSPALAKKYQELGFKVLQGYGLTETSGGITVNPIKANRVGTVGRVIDNTTIKISDEGEIICSGPSIFDEYYKNPQATEESFVYKNDKKWFKTGDLGNIDQDGYLSITGRKKDLIVTSYGKKVLITKLETLLESISYVNQALIIGENRKYITALVTLDNETCKGLECEEIEKKLYEDIKVLNQSLARYEQVRKFTIIRPGFSISKGELTPTLKLKRRVIQENHKAEIEAMYQDSSDEYKEKELIVND